MGKTKELSKDIRDNSKQAQGWDGLQENKQATWWEVNNCWSNYSKMEETQSHRQSPSVWGSMQDLISWDINDDEKGQGSAQYYTGGAC